MKQAPISLADISGQIELRNQTFREEVGGKVLALFRVTVLVTGILVIILAAADAVMIWHGIIEPEQRLVTSRVLMSLIGATFLELGAALGAIVYALFKTHVRQREAGLNEIGEKKDG